MALPKVVDGYYLAEQKRDENGKVAGENRGRAFVVSGHEEQLGTEICFPEYAGWDVEIDGKPYLVVKQDDVWGWFAAPETPK